VSTSGSVDFAVTRNEIITEALELLGVLANGDTADANDVSSCSRTLNMMIKHWQANGVCFWKSREVYLFLVPSTAAYSLGPSGTGNATLSFTKTEVATAAVSGASTLVVDSISGISDGDYIGVELDGGSLQWTTVNGTPSAATITLTDVLTDDVSVDANVYAYTSGINRPLFITEGRLHMDNGVETPLDLQPRNEYKRISQKTLTGSTVSAWYDPQLTNGVLYIWPTPTTVKDYLVLTARMPIEDFDNATDNPDFPQEWLLPLAWNLAVLVAPKFNQETSADFKATAGNMFANVADSAADYGSLFIEIGANR